MREHNIVVLKGDGIGPEIVDEAVKVLDAAGKKYGFKMNYDYELMGGCAIDETGEPLPQKTVDACKKADCVFLGAVGGPKWDGVPGNKRPEAGLLGISGVSNDARDIEKAAADGNADAALALNVLAYSARSYIGAFAANLGGLDAISCSGGIGENSPQTREKKHAPLE